MPFGLPGGGGDFVTGVFVAAQRFDFATFDHADPQAKSGAVDESGAFVTLRSLGNYRATIGMLGSGFIEMLARQMTADLQAIRDATSPGQTNRLITKGVSFDAISCTDAGAWNVSAVEDADTLFSIIGCSDCHVPALPLIDDGWIYTEPNPYNPQGNLQVGDAPTLSVDFTREDLPGSRPKVRHGVVWVRAFTDLKLHDITSGPGDPNAESIDINQPSGTAAFFAGNRQFLTKKLWGAASEPPFFHHGLFTTLRAAILAHDGEAAASRLAFEALPSAGSHRGVPEILDRPTAGLGTDPMIAGCRSTGNFDGFCIASSDCDFTRLAPKLRAREGEADQSKVVATMDPKRDKRHK